MFKLISIIDKNKMKHFTFFMITALMVYTNIINGQENHENTHINNIHEIYVQPIGFFSYSFMKNFNNKFRLGAKIGLGVGAMYRIENVNEWYYKNMQINIFTRNLLREQKHAYRVIYDLGVFASTSLMLPGEEALKRFGMSSTIYYRWGKFMFGFLLQLSAESILTESIYEFPKLEIIPLTIVYKF